MTIPAAADPTVTTVALAGDRQIVMTRTFAAPRELVRRAVTQPQHFARWWGPRGFTCEVREMDVRHGGRWSADQTAPDGGVYRFWGEYLEVDRPGRIVHTQRFLEFPPLHVTVTLEERDGATLLTSVTRVDSAQGRDALLASGMERGARQIYDRLAELLETM
jgi:uncharacterized protein YndB with AHSA1/START domain